jgi:hypothetical protein
MLKIKLTIRSAIMKFNNAYDLILFLYNKGLFIRLYVSLGGIRN